MKTILLREMPVLKGALDKEIEAGLKPCLESPAHVMAPAGTVIEGPDAWRGVHIGWGKPGDQECRDKCKLTDLQILERYGKYDLLEKGQLSGDQEVDRSSDVDGD